MFSFCGCPELPLLWFKQWGASEHFWCRSCCYYCQNIAAFKTKAVTIETEYVLTDITKVHLLELKGIKWAKASNFTMLTFQKGSMESRELWRPNEDFSQTSTIPTKLIKIISPMYMYDFFFLQWLYSQGNRKFVLL